MITAFLTNVMVASVAFPLVIGAAGVGTPKRTEPSRTNLPSREKPTFDRFTAEIGAVSGSGPTPANIAVSLGTPNRSTVTGIEGTAGAYGKQQAVLPAVEPAEEPSIQRAVLIRPGVKVHRLVVTGGPEGDSVSYAGIVDRNEASCEERDDSAYCNTLSSVVMWYEDRPDMLIADDIVLAKAAPCVLDRFIIRVTGDQFQDGSGTALGEYTVSYALYETCPARGDPRIIRDPFSGEEAAGEVTIPASQAGDIVEIVHTPTADITLPTNELYLGISFSREKCGVVTGAPATKGFSGDALAVFPSCTHRWGGIRFSPVLPMPASTPSST